VRRVAAFDLDGTLTRRDTLLPFLLRSCGRSRTAAALMAESLLLLRGAAGNDRARDDAKAGVLRRLLAGRPVAPLLELAETFADDVMGTLLRTDAAARIEKHRSQGHELVIVTASPELYVGPLARRLGIDHVLGTRLEVDDSGVLTGRLLGANCRGAEKVARLQAWLGEEPYELWAYGDSAGDRELLALAAANGTKVGRESRRRRPA
jgi:phosphatidylglycerophosphatase C